MVFWAPWFCPSKSWGCQSVSFLRCCYQRFRYCCPFYNLWHMHLFFTKEAQEKNEWSLYSRDENLHSYFLSWLTFKLNLTQPKVTWEDRNSLEEFCRSYWSVTISHRDQLLMWDGPGSCGNPMHMGLGCIRKQDKYYPVNNTRNNSPLQFLTSDSCFSFCPDLPQ